MCTKYPEAVSPLTNCQQEYILYQDYHKPIMAKLTESSCRNFPETCLTWPQVGTRVLRLFWARVGRVCWEDLQKIQTISYLLGETLSLLLLFTIFSGNIKSMFEWRKTNIKEFQFSFSYPSIALRVNINQKFSPSSTKFTEELWKRTRQENKTFYIKETVIFNNERSRHRWGIQSSKLF